MRFIAKVTNSSGCLSWPLSGRSVSEPHSDSPLLATSSAPFNCQGVLGPPPPLTACTSARLQLGIYVQRWTKKSMYTYVRTLYRYRNKLKWKWSLRIHSKCWVFLLHGRESLNESLPLTISTDWSVYVSECVCVCMCVCACECAWEVAGWREATFHCVRKIMNAIFPPKNRWSKEVVRPFFSPLMRLSSFRKKQQQQESVHQTNCCGDINDKTIRKRIKKTKPIETKLTIFASHVVLLEKLSSWKHKMTWPVFSMRVSRFSLAMLRRRIVNLQWRPQLAESKPLNNSGFVWMGCKNIKLIFLTCTL